MLFFLIYFFSKQQFEIGTVNFEPEQVWNWLHHGLEPVQSWPRFGQFYLFGSGFEPGGVQFRRPLVKCFQQ